MAQPVHVRPEERSLIADVLREAAARAEASARFLTQYAPG